MVTRSQPGYVWDFCGGDLAADFTNTVGSRGESPEEHFNVYADALSWAETRGVLARADARRLAGAAGRAPHEAAAALQAIVALRESLYGVMAAAADGRAAPPRDLAALNGAVAAAYARARLTPRRGGFEVTFDPPAAASLTQPILDPIIRAAIALLTGAGITRVRLCADRSCGWLFVDATRSRTRRWCDMAVCGNRNKVRRFRKQPEKPKSTQNRP